MMWIVRTPAGKHAQEFLKMGLIGIGWARASEQMKSAQTPKEFYDAIRKSYPEDPPQNIINSGSQLHKFFRTMPEATPLRHTTLLKENITSERSRGRSLTSQMRPWD